MTYFDGQRASTQGERYLVLCPRFGLANRLQALASAQIAANITKRKLVLAWETQAKHMPALFEDLFTNDFPRPERVSMPTAVSRYLLDVEDGNREKPSFDGIWTDKSDVIHLETFSHFLPDRYLPVMARFYRSLEPVRQVRDMLDVGLEACAMKIGVHYRSFLTPGDAGYVVGFWSETCFIDAVEKVIVDQVLSKKDTSAASEIGLVVTSDRPESRIKIEHALADRLRTRGERVRVLGLSIDHVDRDSVEAQRESLAEWLLLGRTDIVIGTNQSTFSEEAARLTTHGHKISVGPLAYPRRRHNLNGD